MSPPPSPTNPGLSLFAHLRDRLGDRFATIDCTKATLVHVSHTIEDLILRERLPALLLTGFQESSHWRAETRRYRALAAVAQQVCIFAGGSPGPDSHEREIRVTLRGDDPLRQEWFVAALTGRISFVLCGQDRHGAVIDEPSRHFQTFWTFEPQVVAEVLDLLESVLAHYRPERLADLRQARAQLPLTQPDGRLVSDLLRELVRFEDQLQHTLRERETRYKIISELTTDYLYTAQVGPDGQPRYAWAADGLTRLTGFGQAEGAQIGWPQLALPEDAPLVRAHLDALLAGREDVSEFRIVGLGGAIRWVRDYARPISDRRSRQVHMIVGAASDITARKRSEDDLQQAYIALEARVAERTAELQRANIALSHEVAERTALSQQLRQQAERATAMAMLSRSLAEAGRDLQPLFDRIAEHTARLIGDACVLTLSSAEPATMELVALSHARPEGAALMRALLPSPSFPAYSGLAAQVVQRGQPLFVPIVSAERLRARLGPDHLPYIERFGVASLLIVPLRAHGRVLGTIGISRDQAGLPYTEADQAFLQDLADRAGLAIENARLFAAAERALAAAERANRAKDEFLATMSHELRTPLNAILGYSESLQEAIYGPLTPRQHGAVDAVAAAGRHLLVMINDILDLAKIEAGRLALQIEPVYLHDVCQASLLFVREQALKKRLRLGFQMSQEAMHVDADPLRLRQMLVNLLSNAVKFTPDDGAVGLEVTADEAAGLVTIAVVDTGIGIAPEDLGRLFQPFSQVDAALNREFEGTGLGLVLVRRLAELHGGGVTVESAPGRGSRFMIRLPYRPAPDGRGGAGPDLGELPAGRASAAAADPARRRILLVEDNQASVDVLSDYLEARGCAVASAGDGREALAQAAQDRPDLILMDIQMPGMDGLEAIRQLRATLAHATTPIIALTALAMPGDRERCLQAGASAYVTKPVRLRALAEMIDQLLERQ